MKYYSLLLALILTISIFGRKEVKGYEVLIDRSSGSVEKGFCEIYGYVSTTDGSAVVDGQVVTQGYKHKASVGINGYYKLTIPISVKSIYFVSSQHHEISVLNYDFKSQHKVKINFNSYLRPPEMDLTEKPVIYLYSDDTTEINLSLKPTGEFSFTYPSYNNGWSVQSTPSGDIIHKNKVYPYLFWEGHHKDIGFNFTQQNNGLEGFFIKTDTCVSFLESSLTQLGLSSTEQTDFITYWSPRMQNKTFAFIQFKELAAYANEVAELNITPKPNSIQRVFMVFEGLDSETIFDGVSIVEPQLHSFTRSGLTLIEWGGSEVSELKGSSPLNL